MTAPTLLRRVTPRAPVTAAAPAGEAPAIVEDTGDTLRVHWPALAVEGLDTGDGRYLEPGGGSHRALPLPLLALPYKFHGGDDAPAAEVFGRITALTRRPGPDVVSTHTGEPFPEGTHVWSADAEIDGTHRHAALVRKGYLRGGSIDIAKHAAELLDEETAALSENPQRNTIMREFEIGGATMVPVPAFADAYCDLVDQPDAPTAVAASALPDDMLRTPMPMFLAPELDKPEFTIPTQGDGPGRTEEAFTAAAVSRRPPVSLFLDPQLIEETPLTIADVVYEGVTYQEVYGHVAIWSRAHIGYGGQKIYARPSRTDYAYFNTGAVRAIDKDGTTRIVAVGHLTMDTGHADLALPAMAAARHYDNTGTAWADVAAGDDKYGVWVHGICKPGITDDQISYAYSHPPSGDWRPIDGGLELVAALCVNTPGIPVARARVASGGRVTALVAAGALAPAETLTAGRGELDYDVLADRIAARLEFRQRRAAELTQQRDALLDQLNAFNTVDLDTLLSQITDGSTATADELSELGLTQDALATFDVSRMPPQLQESYISGKAAAKIAWGSPGDFDRCLAEARHHGIPAHMRKGMCATLHKKATGQVPGKH